MNFYDILGVSRTAEQDVIEAAYRAMMRKYHPDKFAGPQEEAERRSKEINAAYAILRDPELRRSYDATLLPEPATIPQFVALPGAVRSRKPIWLGLGLATIVLVAIATLMLPEEEDGGEAVAQAKTFPTDPMALPSPAESTEPAAIAVAEEPGCRGVDCRVLTPFGWAGIEAGVSTDSAAHSSGLRIEDDGHYTDVTGPDCLSFRVAGGPENLMMMVENDTVTTIEVYLEEGQPIFRTDRASNWATLKVPSGRPIPRSSRCRISTPNRRTSS